MFSFDFLKDNSHILNGFNQDKFKDCISEGAQTRLQHYEVVLEYIKLSMDSLLTPLNYRCICLRTHQRI